MNDWVTHLQVDPLPQLLSSGNEALIYFVNRDLLEEEVPPVDVLWELPVPLKIVKKQQENGSWKYPGKSQERYPEMNYSLVETYRNTGILVEEYGFNKDHPAIQKAADYLFSCQTAAGDIRGIYGIEYSPNYSAAIMELLIKAGYENDPRIEKGFQWLLSMRQHDGGWASPLRTIGVTNTVTWFENERNKPVNPDKTKPFSHMFTGMVLRAFAAHPVYRKSEEAKKAGSLLLSRFFKPDTYTDRRDKSYWEKVSFPFWFTDVVSALDSLSLIGVTPDELQVRKALTFLKEKQEENGLFTLKLLKAKDKALNLWVTLAVCRIFKRLYNHIETWGTFQKNLKQRK